MHISKLHERWIKSTLHKSVIVRETENFIQKSSEIL